MVPVDIVNKDEQEHAETIVIDIILTELGHQNKEDMFQSCHTWNIVEV
jgi:hypothetical protein